MGERGMGRWEGHGWVGGGCGERGLWVWVCRGWRREGRGGDLGKCISAEGGDCE